MRKLFLFIGVIVFFVAGAQAQSSSSKRTSINKAAISFTNISPFLGEITETTIPRKCGTMEYMAEQKLLDPTLETRMQQLEEFTQEWVKNNPDYSPKAVITVPVVVHIVYSNTAYNITDAVVQEQINILNTDYAGLSTHSMGGFGASLKSNTELQFCLAKRDPNGVATTGIERRGTTGVDASFSTDNQVKHYSQGGLDQWNPNKYMNIWVCNLGSSLCGYAEFPVGTGSISSTNFGVVIHYDFFGVTGAGAPYNLGGTTTHEIGHCFNLYHIWGDDGTSCSGTDYVTDTPNQAGDRSTCPATGAVVTDACTTTSPGIMYMNFMDYSFDACYANFTPGQKTRIQACFASNGPLYQLGSSDGCTPVGGVTAPVANFTASATNVAVGTTVTFTDQSTNTPTSWSWALTPATGFAYANSTTSTSQNPQITFNTVGTYTVALTATNTAGNDVESKTSYITVSNAVAGCDTVIAGSFTNASCSLAVYVQDAVAPYDSGYIAGQNAWLDKEKAMLFTGVANGTVSDVFVMYALKAGTTGTTTVKIYSSNAGVPGTLLGTSAAITKSAIDTTNQGVNFNNKYHFATPVSVSGDYFVSVVLPVGFTNTTNTLAIWSATYTCATTTAYEMWEDNTWNSYIDVYGANIDMAIFPEVCVSVTDIEESLENSLNLFPNPTNDKFTIDFGDITKTNIVVSVYNMVGELIQTINKDHSKLLTIDLSSEKSGIYIVNIKTSEGSITKRINLIK